MNTEFPSRIPVVKNNTTRNTTTANTNSANNTNDFQKAALNIFKGAVDTLNTISNTVYSFTNKYKANKKTEVKSERITKPTTTKIQKEDSTEKRESKNSEDVRLSVFKQIYKTIKNFITTYKANVSNIQRTIESTNTSIGASIGNVFGSGLFGKMISGIITKALNFAVSKILLGVVAANLPTVAIVGGIIALVALGIYYWKEIWDAIKFVGYAIDQGIDAIIDVLPWGKSKYIESRKEMATAAGISQEDILKQYGDTIKGRNQAYEDWKKAQTDPEFYKQLMLKLNKDWNPANSVGLSYNKPIPKKYSFWNDVYDPKKYVESKLSKTSSNAIAWEDFKGKITGTPSTVSTENIIDSYNTYVYHGKDETEEGAFEFLPTEEKYPMTPIPVVNNTVNNNSTPIFSSSTNANLNIPVDPINPQPQWYIGMAMN